MDFVWMTCVIFLPMVVRSMKNSSTLLKDFCIENTCFHLYEYKGHGQGQDKGYTWDEARKRCAVGNAYLAAMVNYQVQNRIHQEFTGSKGNETMKAWIGGQESTDDRWRWLDGTAYNGSMSTHKPDEYKTCAWIRKENRKTQIFPKYCAKHMSNYMCSFEPENGNCNRTGSGSEVHINTAPRQCHVLYHNKEQLTWYDAQNSCILKGGTLASFNLYSEETQQQYFMNLTSLTDAWIGLRRRHWRWTTLDPSPSFTYTSWNPGAPSNIDENCALLYLKGDVEVADGKWGDEKCDDRLPYFICQNGTGDTGTSTRKPDSGPTTAGMPTTATPSNSVPLSSTASSVTTEAAYPATYIIAVLGTLMALFALGMVVLGVLFRQSKRMQHKLARQLNAQSANVANVTEETIATPIPLGNQGPSEQDSSYAALNPYEQLSGHREADPDDASTVEPSPNVYANTTHYENL